MFRARSQGNMMMNEIIDIFSQTFNLFAVAVMVVGMYVLAKKALIFAMGHIVKYMIFIVLRPFADVPTIGPPITELLVWLESTDVEAYGNFNESIF